MCVQFLRIVVYLFLLNSNTSRKKSSIKKGCITCLLSFLVFVLQFEEFAILFIHQYKSNINFKLHRFFVAEMFRHEILPCNSFNSNYTGIHVCTYSTSD